MIVVEVLLVLWLLVVIGVLLLAGYWTLRDAWRSWRHPGYLAPVVPLDERRRP